MKKPQLEPIRSVESRPISRQIPADNLVVYQEVQRLPPTQGSVRQIADGLDFSKLGVCTVNERVDGTFSILDGQRRVAALKMRGLGTYRVDCRVYTHLSEAQEAEIFLGLNAVRVANSRDRFFPGLTANRPECVGVVSVCEKSGWKVSRTASASAIACTEALLKAWHMDGSGDILGKTLRVLTDVFGHDRNTMGGHQVQGMAKFLWKQKDADLGVLKQKLGARFGNGSQLVAHARARREIEEKTTPMSTCVADTIATVYGNKKKRT